MSNVVKPAYRYVNAREVLYFSVMNRLLLDPFNNNSFAMHLYNFDRFFTPLSFLNSADIPTQLC